MTYTEVRLWLKLKGRQLGGWKFRRQTPIGPFIVDFYCPAARLVIELNGASHIHEDQFDYDQRRRTWLESHGYTVLTFSAYYSEDDYLDGVWDTIRVALAQIPNPRPSHRAFAMQDPDDAEPEIHQSPPPPALRATSPHSGEDIA